MKPSLSILVNGKSRMPDWKFNCNNEVEVSKYLQGRGGNFEKSQVDHSKNADTQYEIFKVKSGEKYRFRILGLIGQNFPIRELFI